MFEPHETALVPGARVIIHPPTTFAGLLCRRTRCVTGTTQIERAQGLDGSADQTRISDLTAIIRRRPGMLPRIGYFLSVAVFARLRASRARARGDYLTWLRDESSRTASGAVAAPGRPRRRPAPGPRSPWPPCPVSRTTGTVSRTTGNSSGPSTQRKSVARASARKTALPSMRPSCVPSQPARAASQRPARGDRFD